ncbi:MAG: ATP synthase F1 subunit gamma [Candidatus Saccharimonadales bacterium]
MANTITLKRRINSTRNTRQITKAMELVAASKMRRAQTQALASRDYAEAANQLLARLNNISEVGRQPLFAKRTIKSRLYIVITSNTGLAGAYNSNVLKLLMNGVTDDEAKKIKSQVIAIGNKGAQFTRHLEKVELLAVYPAFGDQPKANDLRPVLNTIIDTYKAETIDEVRLLYTAFKSSLSQQATSLGLMPAQEISIDQTKQAEAKSNPISTFEPDIETVIEEVGKRLIEANLWQALLESIASEHSMRMLAMRSATDNASDLIDEYTLAFNTARQAAITQELAEITGGAEAMNS